MKERQKEIERSIITKFRKSIWRPFTKAVRDYELIQENDIDFGVAICGSGIGISITLNKMKRVYCAKVSNALEANYTRIDNDTNVVAFSGDISLAEAIKIVDTFIHTKFSDQERHKKRINKIKEIEEKQNG